MAMCRTAGRAVPLGYPAVTPCLAACAFRVLRVALLFSVTTPSLIVTECTECRVVVWRCAVWPMAKKEWPNTKWANGPRPWPRRCRVPRSLPPRRPERCPAPSAHPPFRPSRHHARHAPRGRRVHCARSAAPLLYHALLLCGPQHLSMLAFGLRFLQQARRLTVCGRARLIHT